MNYFLFITGLLLLPTSLWAETLKQKSLNFKIDAAKIYSGDILFSARLVDQEKFKTRYKKINPLDVQGIRKEKNRKILIIKSAFMVKVAPGFFNQQNLLDTKFIAHLQEGAKVTEVSDDQFKIKSKSIDFIKKIYFDSDDITSVGTKKLSLAVKTVKEIDVISQSSFATLVEEDGTSKEGGIIIQSFVPLKKDKTLIIRYELISLPQEARKETVYPNIPSNLERYQKLFEEFKAN
jgi:hypothetical protein